MSLEVIDVNGLATIQDSGRKSWRHFGVPASGPMDVFAFRAANALAGNPSNFAVVEIGLGHITFRALQDCVIAVTGTGYNLTIYLWEFPLWSSFFVRAGWIIRFNKMDNGMWAYLRGSFGGLQGRPLQADDRIPTGKPLHAWDHLAARTLPIEARPSYSDHPIIEIIMGPQAKYFSNQSIETFLSSEYSISLTSDRMGYRLEGLSLIHRRKTELISEGITFGTIQVTASGQPIVMMADCPTTGGYPKIAAVTSADLPLLAQCVPNKSKIRFQETTIAKAQRKYRALMNGLASSVLKPEQSEW